MDDDYFLKMLVGWVKNGTSLPVTLCVRGVVISGVLVDEDEYFEALAQGINVVGAGDDEEGWRELFRGIPSLIDSEAMDRLDEGQDPSEVAWMRQQMSAPFIHLKDTWVKSGGQFIRFAGGFWRGRTDAVDGFWLGSGQHS